MQKTKVLRDTITTPISSSATNSQQLTTVLACILPNNLSVRKNSYYLDGIKTILEYKLVDNAKLGDLKRLDSMSITLQLFSQTQGTIVRTTLLDAADVLKQLIDNSGSESIYRTCQLDNLQSDLPPHDSIMIFKLATSSPLLSVSLHTLQTLFYDI